MYWQPFYYFRHSLRSSLWTVPIVAIPFAMFATRLAHWLDERLQWTFLGFGPKGAEALLQATATATLSFLVFTFSSLLVALQVASGQLTPRIIATTLLRDSGIRWSVALFVYALASAVAVKSRVDVIPHSFVSLMGIVGLSSVVVFLFLIDHAA